MEGSRRAYVCIHASILDPGFGQQFLRKIQNVSKQYANKVNEQREMADRLEEIRYSYMVHFRADFRINRRKNGRRLQCIITSKTRGKIFTINKYCRTVVLFVECEMEESITLT